MSSLLVLRHNSAPKVVSVLLGQFPVTVAQEPHEANRYVHLIGHSVEEVFPFKP
jgi:hypothetical protein